MITKVAVIRDPSVPMFQPARLWLNCPCGAKPPVDVDRYVMGYGVIHCSCGITYNAQGWVQP